MSQSILKRKRRREYSVATGSRVFWAILLGLSGSCTLSSMSFPLQQPVTRPTVNWSVFLEHKYRASLLSASSRSSNDRQDSLANRRRALVSIASLVMIPSAASASRSKDQGVPLASLENISVGDGQWIPMVEHTFLSNQQTHYMPPPPYFITYATRFLISYDAGINSWWMSRRQENSLLSDEERRRQMNRDFGSLAKSIELAMLEEQHQSNTQQAMYNSLWDLFKKNYGSQSDAQRQLLLLFSLLPDTIQPVSKLQESLGNRQQTIRYKRQNPIDSNLMRQDLAMLLPEQYTCVSINGPRGRSSYRIEPPPDALLEHTVRDNFGQATAFGPLGSAPLTRDIPRYGWETYALFGLAGATGCALTHSVVIPLDVVKTRAQTNPNDFSDVVQYGQKIYRDEGMSGLFLGAQATIAGYCWYGLSVYPSYAFFKRFLTHSGIILSPQVAMAHANDIALVAGALAAVVASLGLTPLEAARIRAVAEPAVYQPLGLPGTLSMMAKEDPLRGWKTLYAGLPSLLTRQVIFGSVKFLAFERACEFMFGAAPFLRDANWTVLGVTLVAGGFSGVLSSVISQPADSVLTYVAKNRNKNGTGTTSLGVLEGSRIMVMEGGFVSLYRGLGSRCVWAGSIIAGQFLLYDVFRTYFGVASEDLLQVYRVVLPHTK
jgi:solute carrier family 25 (mitochondrial phosphate transporter), member 3